MTDRITHENNKPDRLPEAVLQTIRWMDQDWLPGVMESLPEASRALIDVYVQMELMLRQPEDYDWQTEIAALRDQYAGSQPVISAFFHNILQHMNGLPMPALKNGLQISEPAEESKVLDFPITRPALPHSRMNAMLQWYENGIKRQELRRRPGDFRLMMDTLIRRGIYAELWADGEKIGGVAPADIRKGDKLIRKWRGQIGGYVFFSGTENRGGNNAG